MAKKSNSVLHDLLISLRRVTILLITAFAIAMDWPLPVVAMRMFTLWVVLAILTHTIEVLFQYLAHRAHQREQELQAGTLSNGAIK